MTNKMEECCYAVSFIQTVMYAEPRKLAAYAEYHYAQISSFWNSRLTSFVQGWLTIFDLMDEFIFEWGISQF